MYTRQDGRRADQLRPIEVIPHFVSFAEGSVLFSMGSTRVLCNVSIEESVPNWMRSQGKEGGWITAEYSLLPRSTHTRTARERLAPSGRTHEIQRLIGRALRAAIDLKALGARTCTVDCDVIQADGGTRTASISGGYIALKLALQKLIDKGTIKPSVFQRQVAAVSVGILSGKPIIDLCYAEDSQADTDATVVMTSEGEFIELQSTAEAEPLPQAGLQELITLADSGLKTIFEVQRRYCQL